MARKRAQRAGGLTNVHADAALGLYRAEFAALTTFGFDPIYFEKRLLRSKALEGAARIVVFVDHREWIGVLRRGDPARHVNTRYLVVPIDRGPGVFHPKMVLLLGREGVVAGCHSANLTRPGYGHNLELLNFVHSGVETPDRTVVELARQMLRCFERIAAVATGSHAGDIAAEWIGKAAEWIRGLDDGEQGPMTAEAGRPGVELWHTLEESIWDRLRAEWAAEAPEELVILSPFFDHDHRLMHRVSRLLPGVPIGIIAQNHTSNLDPVPLASFPSPLSLISVDAPRRLHAKAIMWRNSDRWTALCGSANWTSAAIDGMNIEASLLIRDAKGPERLLDDDRLRAVEISLEAFTPGDYESPGDESHGGSELLLREAMLDPGGSIVARLGSTPVSALEEPILDIWFAQHSQPSASLPALRRSDQTLSARLPEGSDFGAGIRVSLRATIGDSIVVSPPVWVIVRDRLEHDREGHDAAGRHRQVLDRGIGLEDELDNIVTHSGPQAAAEYLRSLTIRFDAGGHRAPVERPVFGLRARDPYLNEGRPEWLLTPTEGQESLRHAIRDFVDRHYRTHLRRHAKSGNVNGLENFTDIVSCLVRVLHRYYERSRGLPREARIVSGGMLIDTCCKLVDVIVGNAPEGKPSLPGYIPRMSEMLQGDRGRLVTRITDAALIPMAFAILRLAQVERASPQRGTVSPAACLTDWSRRIARAAESLGLNADAESSVPAGFAALGLSEAESHGPLATVPG